ncbi:MAG: aminotransferase class I/II-fold pyridoxal phosphate-dependent enzyme, partial [Anaerovoracaceae bacterium]
YSLALAKEYLCEEDTLLFESDLIFEDSVLEKLLKDSRESLALVDKYESWMDGTCVKLAEDDTIEAFVPGAKHKFEDRNEYYKTVNIYKFGKEFSRNYYVPFLDAYSKALGNNEYYEQVLRVITMLDEPVIKAKRLEGEAWYEIDDIQDLDIASSIFMPDAEEKVGLLQSRYGGYWRYPKLIDFSYLVNPYFPPQKMIEELKANFEKLLTQYPSGMRVNSLLASKNFDVPQNNIVVGNGAAELIKALMEKLDGTTGIIKPTFEEYPNRYDETNTIVFEPCTEDFSYSAKDVINYFGTVKINNLILINPDNPSGNYIPKKDIMRLIEWTKDNDIKFVVDESFVDFADEEGSSLIETEILLDNPHLFVMKSISKSYGVPGLRLGVLASGNRRYIDEIKNNVAIWNINSFAEFYMQIEEKYKKDYYLGLVKFKDERKRFEKELKKVPNIKVISSQANYIMVEFLGGYSAKKITETLLFKYGLFIKDLTSKLEKSGREFVRIAIRNTEDNNRIIESLMQELK